MKRIEMNGTQTSDANPAERVAAGAIIINILLLSGGAGLRKT
jgi:hypothetical protein